MSSPTGATPTGGIEATRVRGASALERALGFVEAKGGRLARTRARVLVELESVEGGVEFLGSLQHETGGFSRLGQVFAGGVDSELRDWDGPGEIVGSLEAMSILSDWKALHTPCAERVIEFLRRAQRGDGAWGSGVPGAPDHPIRLFATGSLAGFLGRSRSARPEVSRAAGAYLAPFWSVDRIRSAGWATVSAFANYFTNVFDEGAEAALPWCARELARGLAEADYSAGMVLRTLFYCEASALPGVEFDAYGLLETLLDEQLADGGFGRESDETDGRIGPTIDAMMCILRLCRASP